jgi:NAD(P)-dependent dehydrogenase (short-subunit alcohol dehydrogenase family)
MGKKSVVVTGASTGIGEATARVLVRNGLRVFGSVRKPSDGERLKSQIGPDFEALVFDVTDGAAIRAEAARVRELLAGETLLGLVNNAGIGIGGPLLLLGLDELRHQFEVNVFGLVAVTQAFAPLLGTDRRLTGAPGRVVNMSSVAGKLAAPFLAPYVASKHAVEGLSQSLRRELLLYGIDVIVIGPGAVATPIWDKTQELDVDRFADTEYAAPLKKFLSTFVESGRKGLPPEDIGALVHHALTTARPRTRYAILGNPLTRWLVPRLLPDRALDRALGKQLGLLR